MVFLGMIRPDASQGLTTPSTAHHPLAMKQLSLKFIAAALAVLFSLSGMVLLVLDPLVLQTLRYQGFDQYQRWQPRVYVPAPVRIIDIDEESLEKIGQWPWPRNRMAEMVERLSDAGAAAIGFDVVFAEPDRTSPQAIAELWPLAPDDRQRLLDLPDHDTLFAEALSERAVVLGFAAQRGVAPHPGMRTPTANHRFVWVGAPAVQALHGFTSAVTALPPLDAAAAGNGALTFVSDGDGVVRRVPMLLRLNDEPIPTLVTETLRVGQDARNYVLVSTDSDPPAMEAVRVGEFTIPTTAQGELWVHYTRVVPERYVPAWQALTGAFDPALIEGHLVLVGSSAQGLMDLRFNPQGRIMPGVEAHAQALEQILTGHFLERPAGALALEALLVVLGAFLLAGGATYMSALPAAGLALASIGGVLYGGWWAFASHGLLINTFTPALVMLATFVVSSLVHHFWSERQQRFIKDAFSRYVSPNRVEYLVNHPGELELGGKRQTCSFIFTDLAGFTSLMEKIDPGQALVLLNRYLEEMISIAFRHQGTLDRIVGDAVAIMFSAPVPQPDHPQRALNCALEMHAFATRYADELQAQGIPFGQTRIGVHSGEVIVGNFGGNAIFDYRALGDPVNTAARLESVNKHLGTRMCVSEVTMADCTGVAVRPVGRLVLKGKSKALQVFEPLPGEAKPHYAPLADYLAAYAALEQGDAVAWERFASLYAAYPQDPLVALHHERLQQAGGVEPSDRIVMDAK